MEYTFKDANGVVLQPGDKVLKAIGSKFVERVVKQIRLQASWRRTEMSARLQLAEVGKSKDGTVYGLRYTQTLGANQGNQVFKVGTL